MAERERENGPAARADALMAARVASRRADAAEAAQGGAPADAWAEVPVQTLTDASGDVSADVPPNGLRAFLRRNKGYLLSTAGVIIAVAVLVVVMGAFMTGCSSDEPAEEAEPAYVSPYDWSALDADGDRLHYVVDGRVKSRIGIDVSENQHDIDWYAVAADGIDFAMIRLGYRGATAGDLYLDEYYWANLDGARAAALDCGVYFFSQAQTVDEAVEEADFVLEYLNGTPLEYPIAFDSEEIVLDLEQSRTTGLGNDQMTAIARAFCDRVEEAGYDSMIYGNGDDMSRYNYDELGDYPIWWAEYETPAPAHDLDIVMWQYANTGEVAGIPVQVDLNLDLSNALE